MRPVLSCAVAALLAAALPAWAQGTLPLDRARMYPQPSRQVWQAALETVAALRMKVDELDAEHQLLITRFRTCGASTVTGPNIPGYDPVRLQLHVFVSPFAEPARVKVGSVSELEKLMGGGTRVMYDGRAWRTHRGAHQDQGQRRGGRVSGSGVARWRPGLGGRGAGRGGGRCRLRPAAGADAAGRTAVQGSALGATSLVRYCRRGFSAAEYRR